MSKPNYRVIVTFDGERKVFVARAPELEHCTADGATRAEAMTKVEEEIDAQLANMLSHGSTPPRAVDEETFSGEVSAKISKTLHRDLAYQARTEGIDLDHLVGELLSSALESRRHTQRAQRSGNRQQPEAMPHDNIGNRHDGGQRRGGGFGGRGYSPQILDDRANFIEYVRGLEHGAHGGHGGNGGFQQRGGGGDRGGDRGGRRRRGGRGGGGGGGGPRPQGMHSNQQNRNGNGQSQQAPSPAPATPPSSGGDPDGNL